MMNPTKFQGTPDSVPKSLSESFEKKLPTTHLFSRPFFHLCHSSRMHTYTPWFFQDMEPMVIQPKVTSLNSLGRGILQLSSTLLGKNPQLRTFHGVLHQVLTEQIVDRGLAWKHHPLRDPGIQLAMAGRSDHE